MMVASNLPGDLTIEILSRLPVKSLLRFRCVHKTWLCLLKSSYFITKHLQNPNNKDHAFVFVKYTDASDMSRFKLLTHDTLEVSLDLGLPFPRWDTVVGSCNGLVCLYIDHHFPRTKIMLYNPALRVHKSIPESTLPGPESRSVGHVFLGFGYDSVNNDYKVVRVVSLNCHKEGKLVSSVKAEVYTLGVNSWREVAIPPGVNFGLYKPQVFLNGAIHWLGMVEKNRNAIKVLVSFDVSTEVFNLIPLPVFAQREIWPMWIDVYKNSLCVVKTAEGPCYEIWVMKEFGVQESWIRLHAIQLSLSNPPWPLGLGMNGKLVLQNLTGLTVYDPNTEEIKNVEFDHPVNPNNKDRGLVFVNAKFPGDALGKSRFRLLADDTLEVSLDLRIPFPWWDNVVGSYNGLVCFCDIDHLLMRTKILLYSPALRVHKIIPESPFSRPKNGCFGPVSLGFGYDSINNVYKNPNNKDHGFLFIKYTDVSGMSRYKLLTHDASEVSLDLKIPFPSWASVVGSCNGLVCLYIDHPFPCTKILLYNPALRVHKIIPESTLSRPKSGRLHHVTFGLGYDSVNNDFKVVRVASSESHKEGKLVSSTQAEVHTLGMNSWKEVAISSGVNFEVYGPQAFFNGAIHWLGMVLKNKNITQVIVSFEVSTEVFKLFPLPDFVLRERWVTWTDVYKNLLCVVRTEDGAYCEIWVMEEYGVPESWTRLHAIQLSLSYPLWFLGLGMNGKLVLENLWGLTVYDPDNEEIKNVKFDHPIGMFTIVTYIESLVSL
ncbi:hypothetical protein SCA6_019116 [Theobroma cacao]